MLVPGLAGACHQDHLAHPERWQTGDFDIRRKKCMNDPDFVLGRRVTLEADGEGVEDEQE